MNLNILKKASPHLDEKSRAPITFLLKLNELTDCIENLSKLPHRGLESCDMHSSTINTEALLRDIRPECNKSGRDAIDLVLNFSKTRDFYNRYKTLNGIQNTLSEDQLTRIEELSKIINHDNNYTNDSNYTNENNDTNDSHEHSLT